MINIFSKLYDWTLNLAKKKHAVWFLCILSIAESSFFPIPPDVILAPMCLASPKKAWRFALLTSIASVFGGVLGYLIGQFAFDIIQPYLQNSDYWSSYNQAVDWFKIWGFWAIFIAGFSPIPYKVFTVAAGAMSMAFIPFVFASIIGRGARFFIIAGIIVLGGERMEKALRKYVDYIGWIVVFAISMGLLIYRF